MKRLAESAAPVIVEDDGAPIAVVLHPDVFAGFARLDREAWKTLDELRAQTRENDPDEVYEAVTEETAMARQELQHADPRGR